MKIVYHIFLILTMCISVISSAGPLETLNIQSCHYICGVSEFMTVIPEDRIHNTVLITTPYAGRGVQSFIRTTLNTAYQALSILDASYYHAAHEFQEVFQNMPSEHIIYIVFDSACFEEACLLPLLPIEAMHSFATLKQNEPVSMQNDQRVEKKTTHHFYIFSLCVWSRTTTLSLSTQEKEKKIELIMKALDHILSSLTQKSETDLHTDPYQNDVYRFALSIQPTSSQHFTPPPAHLMLPPRPLIPSLPYPSYMSPFAASIQPYATPVSSQFTVPPLVQPYTIPPPVLPPLLPFTSSHTTKDFDAYLANAMLHLSTTNVPNSAGKKAHHQTECPFLQQMHTIGSFEIPMCDSQHIWKHCANKFGSIIFQDYSRTFYYFLSNFFSCTIPFSIDNQKTSWRSVVALMSAKKLDYFDPPLPEIIKQSMLSHLQNYDQKHDPHITLQEFKKFKKKFKKQHYFHKKRWKKIATTLLFHALYYKFDSNPYLQEQLLHTNTQILLYQNSFKSSPKKHPYSREEYFWGVNLTLTTGYNVMGNFLCLVREYLKNDKPSPPPFHDT